MCAFDGVYLSVVSLCVSCVCGCVCVCVRGCVPAGDSADCAFDMLRGVFSVLWQEREKNMTVH